MNSNERVNICSLFSVLPSPSDWPSTAPNPSLSMQLWVSRRARMWQTMCRLSAPVGYCIITHTDDSWPTHSTTEIRHPRVPKLKREPVFITWKDTKIFYATSAQLASESLCLIFCSCCREARIKNTRILKTTSATARQSHTAQIQHHPAKLHTPTQSSCRT